jgi:hypothetical protein
MEHAVLPAEVLSEPLEPNSQGSEDNSHGKSPHADGAGHATQKPTKNLPTDRYRGGFGFVETRTSAYYIKLGYLAGLGRSSVRIAEELGDGIHPSYVRTALRRAGFPQADIFCQVPLTNLQRYTLCWHAEKAGMTPEEWLAQQIRSFLEIG